MLTETPRSVRRSEDGDQGQATIDEPEVLYSHETTEEAASGRKFWPERQERWLWREIGGYGGWL